MDDHQQRGADAAPHECSGEEATHVMEVLMGVFESAAYQRTVHLPQAERGQPLLRWRRENGLGPPDMSSMPRDWKSWLMTKVDSMPAPDARDALRRKLMAPNTNDFELAMCRVLIGRSSASANVWCGVVWCGAGLGLFI